MKTRISFSIAATAIALVLAVSTPAHAQSAADLNARLNRLEQDVQRMYAQVPGGMGLDAPNPAAETDLVNRILALERAVEQLTGTVEESRFKTDRMSGQLQVLTDDLSLRMATVEQSLGITPAPPAPKPVAQAAPPSRAGNARDSFEGGLSPPRIVQDATSAPRVPVNVGPDAPLSAPVAAPPRTITPQAVPSAGAQAATPSTEGEINAAGGFVVRTDAAGKALAADPNAVAAAAAAAPPPPVGPAPAPKAAPAAPTPSSNALALAAPTDVRLPEGTPKSKYDFAFNFLKQNDYPRAQVALKEFLKAHPKDPLAGNAQYWLGETYYVRGDYPQAAQEFMTGYQNYPKNNKGPDNLLKLGMSLEKLSQKDGACTAWSRISKDYPDAESAIVKSANTERQKLKCK